MILMPSGKGKCFHRQCGGISGKCVMALEIFNGSSSIRTTSAASIAASEPSGAHGDTDICPGKDRSVINAIAHKGQFALFQAFLARSSLYLELPCLPGASSLWTFVHAQFCCYLVCHFLGVPGEHNGFCDAGGLLSAGDSFFGVRLDHIRNKDMSRIFSVNGHVDDRAHADDSQYGKYPVASSSLAFPAATGDFVDHWQ